MERDRKVHIRELILGVEVRRIGDDPPSPVARMDVSDVVAMTDNGLRINLLKECNFGAGRLRLIIVVNGGLFLLSRRQHDRTRFL
jgi:hypothetical protein